MIVSKSNVVHYLLEQGLMPLDSVVDGDVMVAEATRRNRNFKIIRRRSQGYFVKQIQNWDQVAVAALGGEATCYRLAQDKPEFAALADLVPRHFLYDPQRHILVTELLPDGETLAEHHRRLNDFPVEPARALGRLFGGLHRADLGLSKNNPDTTAFKKQIPWILWAYQHGANLFSTLSAANAQLLQTVQSYPEFQQRLDELRQEWRAETLIHGDVKWDNCVLYRNGPSNSGFALKVVDWELADIGDPRWDLGALLQAYISFWILSMPMTAALPAAQLAETAQYPIEKMQPSIRALWTSYVETRGIEREAAGALLNSSMKYGAARMIQTAYEYMQFSTQISSNALCLLQVSFNILKDPPDAVTHLLGL